MNEAAYRWVMLPVEVLLSSMIAGSIGVFIAHELGFWLEPFAGVFSAITAITVTYIRAPILPVVISYVAYFLVVIFAADAFWDKFYLPNIHSQTSRSPNFPFWLTLAVATLTVGVVTVHAAVVARSMSNTSLERTRDR